MTDTDARIVAERDTVLLFVDDAACKIAQLRDEIAGRDEHVTLAPWTPTAEVRLRDLERIHALRERQVRKLTNTIEWLRAIDDESGP